MTRDQRLQILEAAAREWLRELMQGFSEHHWCASWLDDLEYTLWGFIQDGPPEGPWGFFPVKPEHLKQIQDLAEAVNGWWVWEGDRPEFISLDEWKERYAKR